ncbi:hypothetical protein ACHAWF_002322, partial [Thalassiosira exigua]
VQLHHHQISHAAFQQNSSRWKGEQERSWALDDEKILRILISERDWDKVGSLLANTSTTKRLMKSATKHIIHHACLFNAPMQVVTKISEIFPSDLVTADDKLKYPIHVAVAMDALLR